MPELGEETLATVRRWLAVSDDVKPDPSAARLAQLLKDPRGLEFTLGFVDRVVRPEDLRVAGRNLERLSHRIPAFLPWYLRAGILLGGGFAPLIPWPIVPLARRVFRGMVGHLIVDASPARLDKTLARLRGQGIRLNLNPLGEAVLGDQEARSRLAGTMDLLGRDDVDYVSIKVSSVTSQLSMWAFDQMVEQVVERLTPLYELAANSSTTKFINLDMEEYRDLDLTIAVFTRLLDQPQLARLEAGIVLQAYLPDALPALQRLTAWATERRARGGAGIKVRVVKGANLAMERVDATLHGWPLATYASKVETDANYKRVLAWALTPEHTDAVRIGVAGHNLFDVAYAWLLAKQRRVETRVDFEMLLGMATAQADAVRRDVGGLLLYTPVVHPHEFDSAISYLVRRLEENASSENFMSRVFELDEPAVFMREAGRFLDALRAVGDEQPTPHRVPYQPVLGVDEFRNDPDTDSSVADNRMWAARILERTAHSTLGVEAVEAARVTDAAQLSAIIGRAATAGEGWAARGAAYRARALYDAADVLSALRSHLIEVMASETGKTLAEGDVEVSEAIDFARHYADRAPELESIPDAEYIAPCVTVVTPPWNFPLAIPAGSILAALAAGSAVIVKPAHQARRTGAVLVDALWEAGIPREVLTLVTIDESELGRALVADERVDRVILTGAYDTARLFRSWRPGLPLIAETSGKNAIVVTPSADLDLAVGDIVRSAFGHAGQKCSAASLVILVGSVGQSERFRRQLVDAVTTLRVGYPQDPATQMGPVIEPPTGKLLDALTTLGEGEEWLVQPRSLDDSGVLWSPGVRLGVVPGSEFHLTEYFGPVLGIMTAATLEEAIELQNAVAYGLTAGIHSLNGVEIATWLERVQAGNLYVNRGITGAIVRRQPFGGWKRSSVGASAKAGGPNYLVALGRWAPVEREPRNDILLPGISHRVASVIKKAQSGMDFPEFDRVRRAAQSDELAWKTEYGMSADVSQLGVERNVLRYRPAGVTVRLSEGESIGHLVRLLAAAAITGAVLEVSTALPLPIALVQSFDAIPPIVAVSSVTVESDAAWIARARGGAVTTDRVRLVGGDPIALEAALGNSADVTVWAGPVTTSGRIELLAFLREQSVSITAHRFGAPDAEIASVVV
jgi:RHH-type proline utilization regulon transcriptional repressor/proline dehydrogenase/delta 1-pyrroline-5-carboxylate dehydrogenase